MFVNGLFDDPARAGDIDFEAHAQVSQAAALLDGAAERMTIASCRSTRVSDPF